MTRAQRLAIVADVCEQMWRTRPDLTTEMITDALTERTDWTADGYAGDYPWSRARRYVQEYLRDLKARGAVAVQTQGSEHYNEAGTLVRYRLLHRTDPLGRCGWCGQVWPRLGLEIVDEVGTEACVDCRTLASLDEQWRREDAAWHSSDRAP